MEYVILIIIGVCIGVIIKKLKDKNNRKDYVEQFSSDTSDTSNKYSEQNVNRKSNTDTIIQSCKEIARLSVQFIGPVYEVIDEEFVIDKKIIKLDLHLVALFWARLNCTLGCKDENIARAITRAIITHFAFEAEKFGVNQETFIDVADNRLPVFDEIYIKSTNEKNFIETMLTELGILIAYDIVNEGYESFSLSSPMPILGLEKQALIDMSVAEFIKNYAAAINKHIFTIRKMYNLD